MTTLQVFLLSKPPTAIYSHSRRLPLLLFPSRLSLSFSSYPSLKTNSIPFLRYRKLSIITPCTFRSENANIQNSDSDSNPNSFLPDNSSQDADTLKVEDVGSGELYESSKIDGAGSELKRTKSEGEGVDPQGLMAERGSEIQSEQKVEKKSRFPVAVFLVGLWAMMKKGFEKFWLSEWMNWWPWHQETRLEKLIADADANPTDAAKQSSLLAELNKHSPESVIKRFDQRELAVDSRGVVEYLRALVATNAISEYLPDEQSGKPSSLPILVMSKILNVFDASDAV